MSFRHCDFGQNVDPADSVLHMVIASCIRMSKNGLESASSVPDLIGTSYIQHEWGRRIMVNACEPNAETGALKHR